MKSIKNIICIMLIATMLVGLCAGCGSSGNGINKKSIGKELGIDLDTAEERYNSSFEEDSGNELFTIVYKDNGLEEAIKNAENWKELPMDESLKELLTTVIPDAEIGYYYFCNKKRGVDDKYDASVLSKEEKNHFVVSVYDVKKMILYYVEVK